MVSIRVIGEDDAIVLASGEAEFELDAMMPVTSCGARGTDELLGRSLILVTSPHRPLERCHLFRRHS